MKSQGAIKNLESNLLERIRQRPPLFLGKRSLSAFKHFFSGYYFAYHELGAEAPELLPSDLHDWVAYRLHFLESTLGYANMILERTPDEARALGRFFELLDEHRVRQAKVVARIRCHPQDHRIRRATRSPSGELTGGDEVPQAEEISIVTYTEDPGFFVVNDDPSFTHPPRSAFCPSLSWLFKPFMPDPEFTTVLDQGEFERLLKERVEFDGKMQEANEVRQRKAAEQQGKID